MYVDSETDFLILEKIITINVNRFICINISFIFSSTCEPQNE